MKDGFLRVAAATPSIRPADVAGNVDAVLDGDIDLFINAYLKWIALGNKKTEEQ